MSNKAANLEQDPYWYLFISIHIITISVWQNKIYFIVLQEYTFIDVFMASMYA